MIVIDASVVYHSYGDEDVQTSILSTKQIIKAPPLILQEVWGFKGRIMEEFNITSHRFDSIWKSFLTKIKFEEADPAYLRMALKTLAELHLDLNDADYIALCLKNKPATFWTYDTPFVLGSPAQMLRSYGIFGNFRVPI